MNDKYMLRPILLLSLGMMLWETVPAQLRIDNAKMVMQGPVHLVMQNMNLVNDGTVSAGNSQVSFTGDQLVKIGGTIPVTFHHARIHKPFGTSLELDQSIAINGTLSMHGGNILLNNYQLDLGNTGTIENESSRSFITGEDGGAVLVTRKLNAAPTAFNPGNIGVEITCSTPLNDIVVERTHMRQALPGREESIHRVFTIKGDKRTGIDATLRLYYLDEELADADETNMVIWTDSDISNSWILAGKDGNDASLNWVSKSGFNRFGRFTLAGTGMTKEKSIVQGKNIAAPNRNSMSVQFYPNPSTGESVCTIFSPEEKKLVLDLFDQQGQLMTRKTVYCQPGITKINWDMRSYAAGMYYIKDNSGKINIKLIKL